MALSADRIYEVQGNTEQLEVLLTQNDIYYKGAIIELTAAGGLAVVATDAAGQGSTAGIMTEHIEVASGVTTKKGVIEIGKVWIPFSGAAQSDVGDYVYASDDGTIAKTAVNADPIGVAVGFKTGYLLVDLRRGIVKTALA